MQYFITVGTNVEHPAGGERSGSLPPAGKFSMILVKIKSGRKEKAKCTPKPALRRCGNCPRKHSILRPVSSAVPAFLSPPDSDPKGFLGFSTRRGMTDE